MGEIESDLANALAAKHSLEDIRRQLSLIDKLCPRYSPEIGKEPSAGHLKRAATASLFRAFETLQAVLYLCDRKLGLEAHSNVRTIVDMAITLLWVGLDESRAQEVWDKSVHSLAKGLERAKKHAEATPAEVEALVADLLASARGKPRTNVAQMVEGAVDAPALKAKKMADVLYNYLYDPLSAASHGDLRFAQGLVNGGLEEAFVPSALNYAAAATEFLLIAAAAQLGFQEELQELLSENKA